MEGEKDVGEVIDDYRSVSIDIDPTTQKAVIAFVKYNFQNKVWTTWMARKKTSGWKVSKITEGLYKISLHVSGDGTIYIMGEKLSDPALTVEKGWSNPDTRMVVMVSVDDGLTFNEILLSKAIEGLHWFPSLPKTVAPSQITAPFYMYMTGNNDSSTVTFGRLPITK